jgi:hypothetical protein
MKLVIRKIEAPNLRKIKFRIDNYVRKYDGVGGVEFDF